MNSHQAKRAADVAVVRSDTDNIAEDTLAGADAIGRYFGKSRRQTFYLCEKKQIPAYRRPVHAARAAGLGCYWWRRRWLKKLREVA
jgi:hypothetical protein